MRFVHAREGRLLAAEEARIAARAETTLLISKAEADLCAAACQDLAQVGVLGNGSTAPISRRTSLPMPGWQHNPARS
jgi:hypothetical protein